MSSSQYSVLETREVQYYKNGSWNYADSIAQLSRGNFYGRNESLRHNDVSVFRRFNSQTLMESGKFPANHTAVYFHDREGSFYVKGRYYGRGSMASIRANDPWYAVTQGGTTVYAVVLRNDCLHKYFDEGQLDNFSYFVNHQRGGTSGHQDGHAPVFRMIDRAFDYLQRKVVSERDEMFLQNIRDDVMYFMGNLFTSLNYDLLRVNSKARLVDRTLDIIHSSSLHDLKISDIAQDLHTNRRNIEIAFGQYLGISPKEYVINLKLNRIRSDLLSVPVYQKSISHIAKSHGIVHMGNFSKAYSSLFHENPSQTRKRASEAPMQQKAVAALADVD